VGDKIALRLRFVIHDPPAGVRWALQLGKQDLLEPQSSSGGKIIFETQIEVVKTDGPAAFRLRGPAVQGPAGGRFVYLNSGTYAGQSSGKWGRRAKVSLESITWAQIQAATARSDGFLLAQFAGTGPDGGPACASIKLMGSGWNP